MKQDKKRTVIQKTASSHHSKNIYILNDLTQEQQQNNFMKSVLQV